jgi:hypothetical protein
MDVDEEEVHLKNVLFFGEHQNGTWRYARVWCVSNTNFTARLPFTMNHWAPPMTSPPTRMPTSISTLKGLEVDRLIFQFSLIAEHDPRSRHNHVPSCWRIFCKAHSKVERG